MRALPAAPTRPQAPPDAPAQGRRPRHLVHVFPNFNIGGAQIRFATLVAGLGDEFRHTVLSLRGDFDAAALLPQGAPVVLEGPLPPASGLGRLRRYADAVAQLRPDVLLTYNWGAIEFALANLAGRTPHIHLEDGFGPEEAQRRLARRSWTRRLALRASHVVVPSRTLQAIAVREWRLPPGRVRYIPNGIPRRHRFDSPPADGPSASPEGRPHVIWVGALRPEKNPVRMLRAFAPLKDRASLLVVGDGPQRATLESEISRLGLKPHVRLLGSRTDTRDLIMQSDVLALSSDTEQMPLVVLEAMDAGLAVASFDVGDVQLMVAPENRSFVVPPSDGRLTEALATLLQDDARRRAIGAANRARVRSAYRVEDMLRAYGSLLQEVVPPADGRRIDA